MKRVACADGPATIIPDHPTEYFSGIPDSVSRINTANPPKYTGVLGSPNNKDKIPTKITCAASPAKTGNNGNVFPAVAAKEYGTDEIMNALQQGARYALSNPLLKTDFNGNKYPTNPAAQLHQVAGTSAYPHGFNNGGGHSNSTTANADKDTVTPVNHPACAAPNMNEFPIMRTGSIFQGAARGAAAPGPDSDRVLFAVDPVTKSTVYCGLMTHAGKNGNFFDDCKE